MEQQCISTKEAAQFLGIKRSLTLRLIAEREIPSIRLGRRVLVPLAALERMIAAEPEKQGA